MIKRRRREKEGGEEDGGGELFDPFPREKKGKFVKRDIRPTRIHERVPFLGL